MKTFIAMLALALPAAAFAHGHLESSTPAKGSTLSASPDSVMLMFNESVDLTSLTLQKAGEKSVRKLGPLPKESGEHLMVPLPKLTDGDYTLAFVAVSSDLHEAKGTIPFRISASAKPTASGGEAGKGMDCCKDMNHMQHGNAAGEHGMHGEHGAAAPAAAPAAPAGDAAAHDHDHGAAPAGK